MSELVSIRNGCVTLDVVKLVQTTQGKRALEQIKKIRLDKRKTIGAVMSNTFYGRFVQEMFKTEPGNAENFPVRDVSTEEALYLEQFALTHAAMGVAGEAGEIVDLLKKSIFTGKRLYTDEIIKELGDLEFYLEALRQQLHITRDEVLNANWRKLSERHGDNKVEEYYSEE